VPELVTKAKIASLKRVHFIFIAGLIVLFMYESRAQKMMSCVKFNKREPNKRFLNVLILGSIMHQMNVCNEF
jgi:hypothetical protein